MKDHRNLESVYDKEIAPLMEKIINICRANQLPMFATFEYKNDTFCTTNLPFAGWSHDVFNHLPVLMGCTLENGINVDGYIMWIMKRATKTGHGSICLQQLGVPHNPKARGNNEDRP